MILTNPTGLFRTVLPARPGDAGNVTFTCSAVQPPRTELVFLKLAPGAGKRRPVSLRDDLARRQQRAELVYTVAAASATVAASGAKQYESGQVLNFVSGPTLELLPSQVERQTTIRHDTNLLDLGSLGLSPQEVALIEQRSAAALQRVMATLNQDKAARANLDIQIADNQKAINEATKALAALDAVRAVLGDADSAAARDRLALKLQQLQTQRTALVEAATALEAQATATRDELFRISQLVR